MRRWAIRAAQWLSWLWATMFLSVSLLHPLTHNPLQHDTSDCFVCVLQKTPAPEPPTLHTTLHTPTDAWSAELPRWHHLELFYTTNASLQPLIPRAPPA